MTVYLGRLKRREAVKLAAELQTSSEQAHQLQRERDLAQEELFRRL